MKLNLLAAAAALALAAAAQSAHALEWTTQLEYDSTGKIGSLGTVKVTDGLNNGEDVTVEVNLDAGAFVDTGGHFAFGFNLLDDPFNEISVSTPAGGVFVYANTATDVCNKQGKNCFPGDPPYSMSPFGGFNNAFFLSSDGGNNLVSSPFIFTVHNKNGLSFAGNQAVVDQDGKLVTPAGTDVHFYSNSTGSVPGAGPGGWWFSADTSGADSNCSPTCVVGGRDAFTSVGVPEPATWALMITGFGAAGAMIRRRRSALA